MRLDSHQQYWQYNARDYSWMDSENRVLKQDYLPQHFEPHLRDNGFHGAIAIQARQIQAETDFLINLAKEHDMIKGIVGWVDLTAANLLATLSNYQGQVVGFRHLVNDPEFMQQPAFKRGIRMLADFDYACDLAIRPTDLEATITLVNEFPNQRFVVNHLAKPEYSADGFTPWAEAIKLLAERDQVFCKLSGMVDEVDSSNWNEEELEIDAFVPFLDQVLESFGANRLMFGSDWPVCTLSATYDEVYDIVQVYGSQLTTSEQDAIMGNTAAAFYRIQAPA